MAVFLDKIRVPQDRLSPARFSLFTAQRAAAACQLSYLPLEPAHPGTAPVSGAPCPPPTNRIATILDSADIHWCPRTRQLLLAIRGSDGSDDWISNFDFPTIPYRSSATLRVHRGFAIAADRLAQALFSEVSKIIDIQTARKIIITGHSRGAALAALIALSLNFPGFPDVSLYLFGSPRIGNRAFAQHFDSLFPQAFRLVNCGDIVSRVPRPWMGFWHIGQFVYISRRARIHTAATGYPSIWLDRLIAAIANLGHSGLASLSTHPISKYLTALTQDKK